MKSIKREMETKKCARCKRSFLLDGFKINKRTGQLTKICIDCLDLAKNSRERSKCPHRSKYTLLKNHIEIL